MSRYLTYTSPARGHLYPIVPTLLALRDRGHDIHVRTLAEALDLPWADWVPFFQHVSPFEPTANLPPSFRLVGPGSWEPPAPLPGWIDELSGPVVLVTTSSERQLDQVLVETALQALAGEPYTVVATTVAHDPGQFTVPPNARMVSWFPHGALLDRAACVVCHGGMGVTQKALAAGVPVCVVPFGRDQFEVAEQVTRLGVGTSVPATDLSATALCEAVRDAVARRTASKELAADFAAYGGAGAAADVVESFSPRPR